MGRKRWTDEYGRPTAEGARAVFDALDRARMTREERELADALEHEHRQARSTWITVNRTRVYLASSSEDPAATRRAIT